MSGFTGMIVLLVTAIAGIVYVSVWVAIDQLVRTKKLEAMEDAEGEFDAPE